MDKMEKEDKNSVQMNGWKEQGHVSQTAAILTKLHQLQTRNTH